MRLMMPLLPLVYTPLTQVVRQPYGDDYRTKRKFGSPDRSGGGSYGARDSRGFSGGAGRGGGKKFRGSDR